MSNAAEIETAEACAAAIAEIGAALREAAQIQKDLDDKVSRLKEAAEAEAAPLAAKRAMLAAQVETYCAARRPELTANGARKFGEFASGTVGWRLGKPTLEVDKDRIDKIVAALKARRLSRMLRVKVELDANAIKKEPAKVKGIGGLKIVPGAESFWIEPVDLPLAERPARVA